MARRAALDILARREHTTQELLAKLLVKGYAQEVAAEVVARLAREGLASDARFVEMLVSSRRARGYGPMRIRHELEQKGVASELIDQWLDASGTDWIKQVRQVREKKYGTQLPSDYVERARQARFLQSRGYTRDQIMRVLSTDDRD